MIRQLRGTVLSVEPTRAVLDVSGLGFEVRIPPDVTLVIGEIATLATHMAIKQDGIELYGFRDALDRDFFERLIGVSGVGPKTAQSMLHRASREALQGAIGKRDLTYLTKVVGLGKKNAEKILVELSDKIDAKAHDDVDSEVFDTLLALGYTEREARKALQHIPAGIVGKEARLKAALSSKA